MRSAESEKYVLFCHLDFMRRILPRKMSLGSNMNLKALGHLIQPPTYPY